MIEQDSAFLRKVIDLAIENVEKQEGGPFAALIVRNDQIIAVGTNKVTTNNDPTAHAEIMAIRTACKKLNAFCLDDCVIYSSCEPCPMCLGAIYWARFQRLVFAADKLQAAAAGFSDDFIYQEMQMDYNSRKLCTTQQMRKEGNKPFEIWECSNKKIPY